LLEPSCEPGLRDGSAQTLGFACGQLQRNVLHARQPVAFSLSALGEAQLLAARVQGRPPSLFRRMSHGARVGGVAMTCQHVEPCSQFDLKRPASGRLEACPDLSTGMNG